MPIRKFIQDANPRVNVSKNNNLPISSPSRNIFLPLKLEMSATGHEKPKR